MNTALVLLTVARDKVNTVAETLADMEGITEVYSVAGRYDLAVVIRVKDNEQMAEAGDEPYAESRGYPDVRDPYGLQGTLPPRPGKHVLHRLVSSGKCLCVMSKAFTTEDAEKTFIFHNRIDVIPSPIVIPAAF